MPFPPSSPLLTSLWPSSRIRSMVACGSRVGLRRYCPPARRGWRDAHRRGRVPAILVVRGLLLGGGNVDGGQGLRRDCPPAWRGLSHPVRYKLNPPDALTFWCIGP